MTASYVAAAEAFYRSFVCDRVTVEQVFVVESWFIWWLHLSLKRGFKPIMKTKLDLINASNKVALNASFKSSLKTKTFF